MYLELARYTVHAYKYLMVIQHDINCDILVKSLWPTTS